MTGKLPTYAAIEAGGTKFNCAVIDHSGVILAETRIPTEDPQSTLLSVIEYFKHQKDEYSLVSIGIASFGPLNLRHDSPDYLSISATPKPGWSSVRLAEEIGSALHLPVGMDTDVNGSALGEQKWGAGKGLTDFVYITIGTGIGGGAIVNGNLVHGFNHNEIGHIQISQLPGDEFRGVCPFHGNCFEGLASGCAIQGRWGVPAHMLPADHPAWNVEAETIARGLASLLAVLAPQRFILGGGVMQQGQLFPMIRRELARLDNGYLLHGGSEISLAEYIVPPRLGPRSGIMGAAILAQQVLVNRQA